MVFIFVIITPHFSVTWSFRNFSNMLICCSRKHFWLLLSTLEIVVLLHIFFYHKTFFFRIIWWTESSIERPAFLWNRNILYNYKCLYCHFWSVRAEYNYLFQLIIQLKKISSFCIYHYSLLIHACSSTNVNLYSVMHVEININLNG